MSTSQSVASPKLVLMLQPSQFQGLVWQSVLRSQDVSVIWESPTVDLAASLSRLQSAGLTLPDLVLIDMQIPGFNAYSFCRWCAAQYPQITVVLTDSSHRPISSSERQWAIHQGATDILLGFQQENLLPDVIAATQRILSLLANQPLNRETLVAVLLSIKRHLERSSANTTVQAFAPIAASATHAPTNPLPQAFKLPKWSLPPIHAIVPGFTTAASALAQKENASI
jgi:CheY-like chemotaxis protein